MPNNMNSDRYEITDAIENYDSSYTLSPDTTIRIAREQYSIFEITRHINKQRIDLAPDFQRFHAWNNVQRSELIESILLGIPIPMLYLFENGFGQRQVVDGKQRLSTLNDFLANQFALSNLKMLSQFNNFYFHNLPPILQAKIEDCQIQTYIIQPPTPEVVKFQIFERINRSGTQLNPQEMRHALHQGNSTELLIDITNDYSFLFLGIRNTQENRMHAEYMALRHLTFCLCADGYILIPNDIKNLNELHSFAMKYINNHDESFATLLLNKALISFREIYKTLHENAFTHPDNQKKIIISIFEILSYVLTNGEVINKTKKQREIVNAILNKYKKIIVAHDNVYSEYKTINALWQRVSLAKIIIEEIKNA
ncbi:hypothetical protein BTO01_20460 [Vibrio jasicida]|uniref:DUF262 domain-containing protein n=1 Tax=Vibrio jasicida TaxID=766224 RepID=UPI0006ACC7E4|nr:DUF262 domain-containing protein [Vibrio jasicida]PQJ59213.1 hypothetical protein BTO01_20460 [Vibrio jasicida]